MRILQSKSEQDEFDRLPEIVSPAHQSFDVQTLWRIAVARRLVILGTVVAVLAVTLVAWMMIVPVYNATAVLMLDPRKNAVAEVDAVLSGVPTDPASIQNQVQILTSRRLATSVVQKLGLDRDRRFGAGFDAAAKSATGANLALETSVDRVLNGLSVDQAGLSSTIRVSVSAADANQSARITNAWVDAYIEDQLNAKFEATQTAAKWLEQRVHQLASQVQGDDAAVQKYKAEYGIVDTGAGGSLIDQQTANVSTQLINAKADLAQKTAAYQRVLELQRAGRAGDATQVVASIVIGQLRTQLSELERQEAQYSERYLSQHPKLIDIRALVREGYFDGLSILRSQDNYVVQWGDPEAENAEPGKARAMKQGKKSRLPEYTRPLDNKLAFTRLPDIDGYAPQVGFSNGFPAARNPKTQRSWLTHCYGMVGAGRDNEDTSGSGAELYVVTGHAPRHLDRNITLLGRVVQGMSLLSVLPRGTGPLGFYEKAEQRVPIKSVRIAADTPAAERTNLEVIRTDTKLFTAMVEALRNRGGTWYKVPAGHIELCNVPIAVRAAGQK